MTESTPFPKPVPAPDSAAPDKFELHYRQQLSALIDGELPADEARFVLRRLQHDEELSGCHERWQLCGDILRGRVSVPAPSDFSARVRQAVAAEAQHAARAEAASAAGKRRSWRWGGSAALAASVAVLALFVTQRLPQTPEALPPAQVADATAPAPTPAATTPQVPTPAPAPADPQGDLAAAVAAAPAMAIAANRRQDAAARREATRSEQAARTRSVPAERAYAAAAPAKPHAKAPAQTPFVAPVAPPTMVAQHASDPFGHPATPLQARPWPRSTLPAADAGSEFTASFPHSGADPAAFYPFEPRLPADAAANPPPHPQR
ncbi:sigma-E factor negative regulatory protein [Xanthomonas rydalmerensis]|uniref:Sigma-E factor negative regulatory protein n=1 Tax=Xanthomonas rydalmerensis TaxID=3046274 RepID=A0ABZ0JL40_9XANT|nr:sigma-E factor negative regulatory protein [Xanthomonas sp. DM-2023]WOS39704.1 sigma-E factor negative regulatory protein [Xanthomonas sp. DM-2023]WOS43888.1 sigma-E factor negative regulatory protein [Xanthomonas sp. DM-2023]WOS48068.1 sigma-E factor negative regulatory protein [Xanthomonas sp. DM-2023]WOS52247.1 sigma-E factor negative regulatory protein [Xanthomonas sp. DM-2023]WOS56431.1 sigma-E factor negative regulatory protein [Xanthomonas sp. DM-2023]